MRTLEKLLTKVVDNADELCNNDLDRVDGEAIKEYAKYIDTYLDDVWDRLNNEPDNPWRVILHAFAKSYEDEKDPAVTFTAYMVITRCMLEEKGSEMKNAIRSQS